MNKELLIITCAVGLAMSLTGAYAHVEYSGVGYYGNGSRNLSVVSAGMIQPGEKTTITVPEKATPGSGGACWARGLTAGRVSVRVPSYHTVFLTPNNPVAVFANPPTSENQITLNYKTGSKMTRIFGFGKNTNIEPAKVGCSFR